MKGLKGTETSFFWLMILFPLLAPFVGATAYNVDFCEVLWFDHNYYHKYVIFSYFLAKRIFVYREMPLT